MSGIERIAKERRRQIDQEGWTRKHDAQYLNGELQLAACSYAQFAARLVRSNRTDDREALAKNCPPPMIWPWHPNEWKPSPSPIRNLEKAGALIAAEIDRIEGPTNGR